ncbi:MAG: DNA repair protein RadC [Deltaproteobacteria bacterium]|nr:DNA repair protein RadC [Deltaproteobacteria bacterium]MBW1983498.1 DNA repair protein RadC [Deltaproteobacteria bacterium]MBW2179990.1 DNA repair protein RadC [Deltaproteobacteria bacterium]
MKADECQKGHGHRKRLRRKFLDNGLAGFHDYEVIEMLLSISTPRKDCKQSAKAAIKKFNTFQGVLEASDRELCEVPGIGPVNIFGIKLIKEVTERYLEKKLIQKDPVNNSKELFDYLYFSIGDKNRECFKVIFLDAKNRIIATKTLFTGTLTASAVYPREVIRAALDHHSAALIFAHNHPSGDPMPSSEDISLTRQLVFSGRMMNIKVHEHLIIGDRKYYSFADEGHIARMNIEYDNKLV